MKTKKIVISERMIKAYLNNKQVYQLRDKSKPLILRFNKARTGGTWYAVNYQKGKKPLSKFASYPLVGASLAKKKLPEHLASKEKRNIEHFETIADLLYWHLDRACIDSSITEGRKVSVKSAINKHLLPLVGNLSIKSVTKKAVLDLLIKPMQEKDYKVGTIEKVFAVLRAASNAAYGLDIIGDCKLPNIAFKDFRLTKKDIRQSRLLLGDIPELMEELKHYGVTIERTLVLMMLYHGTRISETALAEWKDIDLKNGEWTIPARNTKTGKQIKIPLADHAYQVLKEWYNELYGNLKYKGKFIFPATTKTYNGDRPINTRKRHEFIRLISKGNWTAHDTRKCCSTSWLEMGFDFFIIECQLNHTKNSQVSAYFQTEIFSRRKAMLEHWQKFLNF